ncbi:MAG: hypothetical protein LW650_06030 [Planctomycetaceae bacterium]|jgi:hypothetical protein|nr:hypothetical protein [Phycisphaerales bacterium]MCE2653059.1 hypothetical protein [Planctomycetaceae bacterium]
MNAPNVARLGRRAFRSAYLRLALLVGVGLIAPAVVSARQTTYEWNGNPSETVTYSAWQLTDPGTVWDTYKRTCTSVWSGPCICTTRRVIEKCENVSDSARKYSHIDETTIDQSVCTSAPRVTEQEYCSSVHPMPTGVVQNIVMTRDSSTALYNNWVGSQVTWDGMPVPFGSAIDLSTVAPGVHQYHVFRPGPTPDQLFFVVQVVPAWSLSVVDYPDRAAPTATLRLANASATPSSFLVRAESLIPELEAEVSVTRVGITPGGSTEFDLRFYTRPGLTVPAEVAPRAMVRLENPGGTGQVIQTFDITLQLPARPGVEAITVRRNLASAGLADQPFNGLAFFDVFTSLPLPAVLVSGGVHAVDPATLANQLRLRLTSPHGRRITVTPFADPLPYDRLSFGPVMQPLCEAGGVGGPSTGWELRAYETLDNGVPSSVDAEWDWITLRLLPGGLSDTFESYPGGSPCVPGGWQEFLGVADTCAVLSSEHAASGLRSVKLVGALPGSTGRGDNIIRPVNIAGGRWRLDVKTYIPTGATGNAYVVMVDQYPGPLHYGAWLVLDGTAGNVRNVANAAQQTPLIRDQWVPLQIDVDLDSDRVSASYNGVTLYVCESWRQSIWFPGSAPLGVGRIAGVVLHGGEPGIDGTTGAFFDDVTLSPECSPFSTPILEQPQRFTIELYEDFRNLADPPKAFGLTVSPGEGGFPPGLYVSSGPLPATIPCAGGVSDRVMRVTSPFSAEVVAEGFFSNQSILFARPPYSPGMLVTETLRQKIRRVLPGDAPTTFASLGTGPLGPAQMAYGPDGLLYALVQTGFFAPNPGYLARVQPDGASSVFATFPDFAPGPTIDKPMMSGLAFDVSGAYGGGFVASMFVFSQSGVPHTNPIYRVDAQTGQASLLLDGDSRVNGIEFITFGPGGYPFGGELYLACFGGTNAPGSGAVYTVSPTGQLTRFLSNINATQVAFDPSGILGRPGAMFVGDMNSEEGPVGPTRPGRIWRILPIGGPGCSIADIVSIGGLPPPDGLLTGDDFNAFIAAFAAGTSLADIVSIGGLPPPDGLLTGDDFNAYIAAFAAGCP